MEKALLLHDRIALSCSYQQGTVLYEDFTIYGALVEKTAVCQGYALAYQQLLEMVGMESELCISDTLDHAWNIVTVNGTKYHVDITWDDPLPDVTGRVLHDNFLRSTAGIIETGHIAGDFDPTPSATAYDQAFWQQSETAFQLVGNEIYYIDSSNATINRCSDRAALLDIEEYWMSGANTYYPGCYSRLSSDGTHLLFSLTDTVYRLDLATLEKEILFQPEIPAGAYLNVYGFTLQDDTLYCTLSNSPHCAEDDTIIHLTAPYEPLVQSTTAGAVLTMQYLIGSDVSVDIEALDQNGDGKLSIIDAVRLLRKLAA